MVAFDLPGHGDSENGDPGKTYNVPIYAMIAVAVIEHTGIHKPVVHGWSLGGYVGLERDAPQNTILRGLAITGTSPMKVAPDDWARSYNSKSHIVLAGKQYLSRREKFNLASHATAPFSAATAYLHQNINRTDGRARFYMIRKLQVVNWPRQMQMLRKSDLPFAILNGADDPFLNHRYIANLTYGRIWTVRPYDIPQGQHAPVHQSTDPFQRRIYAVS